MCWVINPHCLFSIFLWLNNRMENIALENEGKPSTNNDPKMTGEASDAVDTQVADQHANNPKILTELT